MNNRTILVFTFFIYWLLFFPTQIIIPNPTYDGWIKNLMIITMAFYFRKDIANIFRENFKWFNISIITFCLINIISIILNSESIGHYVTTRVKDGEIFTYYGITSPKATIYFSTSLIVLTLFVEHLTLINKGRQFLLYLWRLSLFGLILIDFDAFSHVVIGDSIGGYIVGTKFQVCYYNIYICALYYLLHPNMRTKKEKLYLFGLIFITYAVSIHTKCSTMITGTVLFLLLSFFIPKHYRQKLSSGLFLIALILIIDLGLFFLSTWLLQYSIIQYFIVNVLGEDLTLTGRLGIYQNIMEAFETSPWFGFGYGNSRIISLFYTGVENPQNGIIEVFLNTGFLGCISFFMIIYCGTKHVSRKDWYKYPIIVYLLTMIFVSAIEVPFEKTFLFFCILLLLTRYDLQIEKQYNIKQ